MNIVGRVTTKPVRRHGRAGSPSADPRAGYILLELVATLALTGLLMTMVLPFAALGTTPSRLLALVSLSVSVLRDTRSAALATGRPSAVRFERASRVLHRGRDAVVMPIDVGVDLLAGGNCPADGQGVAILFRPDGTSCGGVLRFRKGKRVLRARVNWADGHIDVVEGE